MIDTYGDRWYMILPLGQATVPWIYDASFPSLLSLVAEHNTISICENDGILQGIKGILFG